MQSIPLKSITSSSWLKSPDVKSNRCLTFIVFHTVCQKEWSTWQTFQMVKTKLSDSLCSLHRSHCWGKLDWAFSWKPLSTWLIMRALCRHATTVQCTYFLPWGLMIWCKLAPNTIYNPAIFDIETKNNLLKQQTQMCLQCNIHSVILQSFVWVYVFARGCVWCVHLSIYMSEHFFHSVAEV